ncbi:MAG TPA: universal stress protein [Thermoanaerobaculia bacterium]|nr:universal stress protein [Thermoanaerobaculia bacterium]
MPLAVRTLVHATDFSPASEQAFDWALLFAQRYGAELHMLHAVVLRGESSRHPDFEEPEELLRRLERLARADMSRLLSAGRPAAPVVREVVRRGFYAGEVILDYVTEVAADLVVMGTAGWRGARRMALGSVAEEVVRHAPCPVLALRHLESPVELHGLRRILVPVDFSADSRAALAAAAELARTWGSELLLLHVVEERARPDFYTPLRIFEADQEALTTRTTDELEALLPDRRAGDASQVRFGRPATEIAAAAADSRADLVVMASHGLTGVRRALFGSTVEAVLRRVECPVLVVKGEAPAE